MEHEVVVPLPAALVHRALQDPAVLTRCVPGLSTDAAEPTDTRAAGRGGDPAPEEIHGRLRLRVGTSTITYRGVISLIRTGTAGVLTAFAEGEEVRGHGEVTATVRIAVEEDGADRTVLTFRGDLTPGGRLTEFDGDALALTGRRLLDRFAAALAAEAKPEPEPAAEPETDLPDDLFAEDLSDLIAFSDPDEFPRPAEPANDGADFADNVDAPYGLQPVGDPLSHEEVLAGPIRRSIVGRSAEEVDHAPPRGRYAPALPARSARARAASRWSGEHGGGAPVASRVNPRPAVPWVIGGGVALLGGAVVLVRVLRKR